MPRNREQELLAEIEAARRNPRLRGPGPDREARQQVYWKMHSLAEDGSVPAISFFADCLQDWDREWRLNALTCIGFHYDLREEHTILEMIRFMLTSDPDPTIRDAAARILGSQSHWPDWSLINTFYDEPNRGVRASAFEAALGLNGVDSQAIKNLMGTVGRAEIEPSAEQLRKSLAELGINLEGM